MPADVDVIDWWSSLSHGGLLIAPQRIPEYFSGALDRLPGYRVDRLRRDVTRVQADVDKAMGAFLDTVFEDLLALPPSQWQKATSVDKRFSHASVTGEVVKPQRVWLGSRDEVLPLFVDKDVERLGIGRGRRQVSRVLEWMRALGFKLAVLTNGRQIRLVHAGADYDAFCEWDVDLWFEEGAPGAQVEALLRLLSVDAVSSPKPGQDSPLLQAILASRRGQGELSAVLGERVRQAVELLIQASAPSIEETLSSGITKVQPGDVYIAATRTVMRLVVVLFAEARGLLPRENPAYHQSYGLQGLREELERAAGGRAERLRQRYAAWPRLLSLFRLIYEGSHHQDLLIQQYGGGLFVPGHDDSQEPVLRALAALESSKNHLTDDVVYRMIELLTKSRMKVRQGRGSTWVEAPVDFSDLSSEYIGILYEGLLDFELRKVPAGEAIVFVNIGDQPALPLSRLKDMGAAELKKLFEKLKAKKGDDDGADEEEEEADDETEACDDAEAADADGAVTADEPAAADESDTRRAMMALALDWAERAVKAAEIVKPPRGRQQTDPVARTRYQDDVARATRGLVARLVAPGEWFLVRWGGTRKGAGTFYTRPQLAGPTTRRTLQPLAYTPVRERTDVKTRLVEVDEWAPRAPEAILALKVCDPAMGSGSFLVSALRYLTDALFQSLHAHGRIEPRGDGAIARLADGKTSKEATDELLPLRPDHPDFEARLKARLKRHVVERCLYGVDIDPVAVELARMALWVETMDPSLPFEFLDHKLKVGNSLVGCWFDRFQDYPLAAWERDAGDEKHKGVHHEAKTWSEALKTFKNDVVKPQLADQLRARTGTVPLFGKQKKGAGALHDEARAALDELHAIPVHDAIERAKVYAARVRDDAALKDLRGAFDAWCALWFWPAEDVDDAPTPDTLHALPAATSAVVAEVAQRERFFHWELEYPDVFTAAGAGFDGIVGNPPWDIQKPNSKEFFSNHDTLYRSYGKQEALVRQRELFNEREAIEIGWLQYQGRFKALSNWVGGVASCWGDPGEDSKKKSLSIVGGKENALLHDAWRRARTGRAGYAEAAHPFRHQGSADVNTYKMFVELGACLLATHGRLGLIVPASFYGDSGSEAIRRRLFDDANVELIYAFQNEKRVFAGIHHAFKMVILIVSKEQPTGGFRGAFRLGIAGSPSPEEIESEFAGAAIGFAFSNEDARRLSPRSRTIVEIRSSRDLDVASTVFGASDLMTATERGEVSYARELDLTNDSKLFPPRTEWEGKGYRPDCYGNWLRGAWVSGAARDGSVASGDGALHIRLCDVEDVALPLYEGRSVGQFDFQRKGWVSGRARRAVWREIPWTEKVFEPQYLIAHNAYAKAVPDGAGLKVAFMDVAASNVERTAIATVVDGLPCGNSAPVLRLQSRDPVSTLFLVGAMNSFVYDFYARQRCTGLHLNWFVIAETPIPKPPSESVRRWVAAAVARLAMPHPRFAPVWLQTRGYYERPRGWRSLWALSDHERFRLRACLDAVMARLYGLSETQFRHVLSDIDHPVERLRERDYASSIDSKTFWLTDRERPPEQRRTVLAFVAFQELQRLGLPAFLSLNDGDGWGLPEHLRLADYGLGRDERARAAQPLASAMGPRLLPWQERQGVAESWEECERHAALLDKLLPIPVEANAAAQEKPKLSVQGGTTRAGETDLLGEPVERDLFGNTTPAAPRRHR